MQNELIRLGKRLQEERKRIGLTQQEIADMAGVRREMWSRYENGSVSPGARVFKAISELGMDQLYILTGTRINPVAERYTDDEKEIITLYRDAPSPVKTAIRGALESVVLSDRHA